MRCLAGAFSGALSSRPLEPAPDPVVFVDQTGGRDRQRRLPNARQWRMRDFCAGEQRAVLQISRFLPRSSVRLPPAALIRRAMLQIAYKSKARWSMGLVDFSKNQVNLLF